MHEESLTKNTKSVLEAIGLLSISKDFYLAGGTALAIHLGHRFSVDLDWFSEKFDYGPSFRSELGKIGKLEIDSESKDTFNGVLNGVKVSFFRYPYPLISSKIKYKDNIFIAGIPDIAAMKMEAIGSRGSYKDFIDIYFILKQYSLEEVFRFVEKKFANIDYNKTHLLKSLIYFDDVKNSVFPEMLKEVSWKEITDEIKRKARICLNNL
ncbi:MAG: nucleotidyl transferase AbiEii/AbiGii toxin family protein [Candidatus Pacebacteria bacterium]|nr:nucleotidyl transferase AbiEii/AbiGii toxin family protein [Candidatus Paceibacterota bacterium]MDD3072456.1 nucleotidyl transferase AbiEii/AbiGii toxin family protein [Candidatus Paceibacterota bacterium]MDD3729247.1 nucleotidyl transferase AbiEii/AbiGii toxin family protein [Candidatus Paceibacterota bacterium]MDD4201286.1 nucleotidyl transferase AbiEii/AbiGii toxin family protein [Candidatus Paceibacterota bacterium]MDD5446053.1 nucleotidyl transferase AbiEii/AbiGii toxin family protein [